MPLASAKLYPTALLLFVLASGGYVAAQDTFSLVAVDSTTGELLSAGGSCIDGNAVAGGARIVSSIVPGKGILHTQSYWAAQNQQLGARLLNAGLPAQTIVDSLVKEDVGGMPSFRQYAALTLVDQQIITAGFTGEQCAPWAGEVINPHFVVAGNILLDSTVVQRLARTYVTSAASGAWIGRAGMEALEAVAFPGADRRCLPANISCRSAFIRVARPGDPADRFYLDLVVEFPEGGRDPIDLLREAFDVWAAQPRANKG